MKYFASLALSILLALAIAPASAEKSGSAESQQQIKVNINKADSSQLAATLKGVGVKKAQAIIDYREKFGPFKSVDELTAVKGIGAKTLEKNRSKISI
ncbi:ComEA family DNA-binding protein [Kangiella sediminilitoris]|uniref:Competence protein ComEA helix-hairpin-helix repeat protein n=1 Tax=Kangiella sediminilitoris TaxID=1144748 RepID=A0A1B3BBM0_9GAMM|nr:ComEA family DNA-binding protein [Kangiella sediminilitoris]AOE50186.1 Competence protein ComEA helix-hairpin-helix repeat protein [Kangiella sediminilitoris]